MSARVEDLVADLRRLGIEPGDTVMVHASLRAIGPVEGGADGVVRALDAAVGTAGTWLMMIGADDPMSWVNEHPEDERADLLEASEPFDASTTPAEPDVGVLAEIMRRTAGSVVSDHPEGRFAARGRDALVFVSEVPWDDYYGPGSPLARLVEHRGKVLRLGAGLDTVTLIHHAEYLTPLEAKRRVRRHRVVHGPDGPEVRTVDCLDDSNGIVEVAGEDYFVTMTREYLATGRASVGPVGAARCEVLDALDVVDFAIAWMAVNLGPTR